ncbi:MAG: IS1595 family transposase, partial [Methylovirgula sp.]
MSTKPKPPTLNAFRKRFPNDDVCLDHLMRVRYGERFNCQSCRKAARYYRVEGRRCFECEHCGFQVYPTAGTPFEQTRTPLTDWFFVMFLFAASRNGIAAKEVERQLGVTYKTAWRMCHHIRQHMGAVDGDRPLGGMARSAPVVEIDEAFLGGRDPVGKDKAIVLGMVERRGEVLTRQVGGRHTNQVLPPIKKWVKEGSRVMTDDATIYRGLDIYGYAHESVDHSAYEYVRGDAHTNTIESFWAMLKRGINGTYIHVSKKHLQKYLWEFEYR